MNRHFASILRATLPVCLTAGVVIGSSAQPAQPKTNLNSATVNNSAAASKLADILGDDVVAKGRGVEVKRSQLDALLDGYKAAMATEGRTGSAAQMRRISQRLLSDIIGTQLLLQKATEEDRRKGQEQFGTMMQKLRADTKLTEAEFEERLAVQLRAQGGTREKWNQVRMEQAIAIVVLERELKIAITDDQVKKYYADFPSRFELPENVRISHILLSTKDGADPNRDPRARRDLPESQKLQKRKKAEDLQKRARNGEDFTKLVRDFSEDPAASANNGEYRFSRGEDVAPQIKLAAFSLTTNQISDVLESPLGYHVIKVLEKIPARKLELEKVAEDIKSQLKQQEVMKLMPDLMKRLQAEAGVEILDEKLKPAMDDDDLPKLPSAAPVPATETKP